MEEIINKIKSDPEFIADLIEFKERIRFMKESEKTLNPFNFLMFFKIQRNTKKLQRVSKQIANRIRAKYNPGSEQIKGIFNFLFNEK
jgi:hypothetical protein